MKILYVFPHPDDESFGPAPGMYQQLKQGHEVYLLTLTKGGATKVRHELGLDIDQMGDVRLKEMMAVEEVLGLTGMTVLDLPDSGLKEMCPMEIEEVIRQHVLEIKPDILITYAVHGISGFHDHLVSHAVTKRVFCELKREGSPFPKRLAFFTLGPDSGAAGPFNLQRSDESLIDCVLKISGDESQKGKEALNCYKTYLEVIERTGVANHTHENIHFEIFQEDFKPPLDDLTKGL